MTHLDYTKNRVDLAGKRLADNNLTHEETNQELDILSTWRAAHSYPLNIIKKRLKDNSELLDKNSLTVQRLKRASSIIEKLNRKFEGQKGNMKLTRMQDVAGCRAILSDVKMIERLCKLFEGNVKHKKINEKNYILNPKKDGYRCMHLVYSYFSDKNKSHYNGLLVEIQIRSKLQHLWATAVEIVDLFTNQAIKLSRGKYEWVEFFQLVSSAFAKKENCPELGNTPKNEKELFLKIKKKANDLNVVADMKKWAKSLEQVGEKGTTHEDYYYLLQINTQMDVLKIKSYSKEQEGQAIKDYLEAEKEIIDSSFSDAVLVRSDNLKKLREAYPNYFVDVKDFLKELEKIIQKY